MRFFELGGTWWKDERHEFFFLRHWKSIAYTTLGSAMSTDTHTMMNVANFEANRHEVLSQRMRSAKATGHMPMWGVQTIALPDDGDSSPTPAVDLGASVGKEGRGQGSGAASTSARPPALMSQMTLTIVVLASIAAIAVLVQMLRHRATYKY